MTFYCGVAIGIFLGIVIGVSFIGLIVMTCEEKRIRIPNPGGGPQSVTAREVDQ